MTEKRLLSVYIVDDEELARQRLKRLLETFDGYQLLGEAENGLEAITSIPNLKPDIVLLDIRMPGEDGLAVAEKLSQLDYPPAIIFCTAYDDYAVSAFKYNAIGYLLKPVRVEELQRTLQNAHKLTQLQIKQAKRQLDDTRSDKTKAFVANTWQGQELIEMDSIYYFKSDQKYLTIVHQNGETLSDQTLKDLEIAYPEILLRAHRNTLVNKQHLGSLIKNKQGHYEIRFKGCDHLVQVSRRHVNDIKQYLASL